MTSTPVHAKQEQEPAAAEVTEVAPGVLRMQLPISMPGLGHVNCYALVDADGAVLVDPGLPGAESWSALLDRLRQAGIPLKRVRTAVVTHSHPDHYGGSHQLREETGAGLLAHTSFVASPAADNANADIDLELLELDADALVELWKSKLARLGRTPWGTRREPPPDEAIRLWIQTDGAGNAPRFRVPEPTIRVSEGEPMMMAGREWFAVHTPGHTADHLCLWDPTEGVLLSGDHVLPTITPHIAGTRHTAGSGHTAGTGAPSDPGSSGDPGAARHTAGSGAPSDPLAAFFESLARVGSFEGVKVCLPAHGHPFSDLRGRTESIHRHHLERLDVLRAAGAQLGEAPVEAFMRELFAPRAWGQMAASETFAHLEHMRATGEAQSSRDSDGLLHYRLPKPDQ